MFSPSDVAVHSDWFKEWFNHPAYLKLYAHRSLEEAERTVAMLLEVITIDSRPPRALDVACGSGRHAVALAENGFEVTANDLSESLLAEARKLAAKKNVALRFARYDMRDLPFENEFDLVVQLFTSFGYFERDDDDRLTLRCVARALKPKGWYVLDFFNANYVRKRLQPETRRTIDGLDILEQRIIFGERVVKSITIAENGRAHRFIESVRLYSADELSEMLAEAGFQIRHRFGDYRGEPFDMESSPRLILIAQK
ncbi:MAG: class I SAM-dependent methyltransferase [Chloroherpetonaceae bacterium]|nr:class I SAM-dependent methyltransferase [Chloroherpetonaceae bacterium]MDW8436675.1 class I SAM-dependent methyltransferase [Chloroherpetonaceae bacterium]